MILDGWGLAPPGPGNAVELLSQGHVDGALVGGASLDVESFTAICQAAASLS